MVELLDTHEAAAILKLRPQTLMVWRTRRPNHRLRFIRLGRTVRYRQQDVEDFIAAGAGRATNDGNT